jgi:hypothetical protein
MESHKKFPPTAYNSLTATNNVPELPTEVWVMIIEPLELGEKKNCRLVHSNWNGMISPLCFETVVFNISEASITNLVHVALSEHLARHVRTLVLQRREGRFRKWGGYDEWEGSISLPDDPNAPLNGFSDEENETDLKGDLMSYHDWSRMRVDEKDDLFKQYETDRKTTNDNMQMLAGEMCFLRPGCSYEEKVKRVEGTSSVTQDLMGRLCKALPHLKQLSKFRHKASVNFYNRWVTHWNRLRINAYDFTNEYEEDHHEDNDIDALHLSLALQALGWAKESLPRLESMAVHVEGPAFWGPRRLRRLWSGEGHKKVRRLRFLYEDAVEAEADVESIPVDYSRHEEFIRQLTMMENTFRQLTSLDCSVSEDEENGGLLLTARPLFEFLCCGQNLTKVRLTFGWLVDGALQTESWIRRNGDGPQELLTLLTNYAPWPKITELHLEISIDEATLLQFLVSLKQSLRHLKLSNVTLAPTHGSWNSALPVIARVLTQLHKMELRSLCDSQHGHHRLLFDAQAQVWAGRRACYDEYMDRVIDQLLISKKLHQLEPESFMQEHKERCQHTQSTSDTNRAEL